MCAYICIFHSMVQCNHGQRKIALIWILAPALLSSVAQNKLISLCLIFHICNMEIVKITQRVNVKIEWVNMYKSAPQSKVWYLDMNAMCFGEGDGTPLQYSCLENPMDGGAWWAAVHGVPKSWTRLSDFTFTFHFHALEKEMATHCSVLAWRIPGTGEPGGLRSMGSHRVGHNWSDLAAAGQVGVL